MWADVLGLIGPMGFNELLVRKLLVEFDEICKIFHSRGYIEQFRNMAFDADLEV